MGDCNLQKASGLSKCQLNTVQFALGARCFGPKPVP